MKTKLFFLMATILMIVACGDNNGTSTDPMDFIKLKEDPKEASKSPDSSKDLGEMPTDDVFYDGLLNHFCKVYYQAKFGKRFKSLFVEDIIVEDDSTVFATGPLTYYTKDKGDKTECIQYKATITRVALDNYRITFEKKGEKYWDDTTQTINYK